ncbi:MAG: hypothetical protein WC817_04415 [Patescibacteria group bacterium]|jgi:hypothetical protein
MAKKKTAASTVRKTEVDIKKLKAQLTQVGSDVVSLIKQGKQRYESVDPQTRKKVAAALGGLVALLAARSVVKKARRQKKAKVNSKK